MNQRRHLILLSIPRMTTPLGASQSLRALVSKLAFRFQLHRLKSIHRKLPDAALLLDAPANTSLAEELHEYGISFHHLGEFAFHGIPHSSKTPLRSTGVSPVIEHLIHGRDARATEFATGL